MWSLGCMAFELISGLPLFPGLSEYDQLRMIIDVIGYDSTRMPPKHIVKESKRANIFFKFDESGNYSLDTSEEVQKVIVK